MGPAKFIIHGEWRGGVCVRPVISPYDGSVVGEVYQATSADISNAIAAAVTAFRETRRLPSHRRASVLKYIADEIERNKEDFARLMTLETGKPITFSRSEVERTVFTFTIASEEAKRIEGRLLPLDLASYSENRFGLMRRFPIGPIGAITSFNFLLNLVAHKVAPAIASGNSIVLKPSSSATLTALRLAEVIHNSGYPSGGFNIVPCNSNEAEQLYLDERVKLISFTGSPSIGWDIKNQAGKKRVVLELGGNAGVIVDRGANLEFAVKRIALGSYGNAGQSCIAVQRIYVQHDLFEAFKERFLEATKSIVVGDPLNEATTVGPMIDEAAAKKVEEWIREAVNGGAKILSGGRRQAAVLEPTVLVGVRPDMKVKCQEVFAPVVTLDAFTDFREAVDSVNDSAFGLQAGIFTNDVNDIFYGYAELEVGGVIVNDYPTYRIDHMPYGGVKDSGFGREGIKYAIEEMTEVKLLAFNFI